jgi:hypothetical protein
MRLPTANLSEKLRAAHAGHLEVGDDGVEWLALQDYEGLFAVACCRTIVIRRAQDDRKKLAGGRFVVNDEHAGDGAPTWRNFVDDAFAPWRKILV